MLGATRLMRIPWLKPALLGVLLLVSCLDSQPAALDDLKSLRPDEVTQLFSTWQQLMDIDRAVWTTFKSNAWTSFSGLLATNLAASANNRDAVARLASNHFRSCLPEEWLNASLAVKQAAKEAALLAKEGKPIPKTTNSVPEEFAETLWIINAIEPWLQPELSKIKARSLNELRGATKAAVETSILQYITFQKRIGKLQVIASLPTEIQRIIGIDERDLQNLLRSLDSRGALTNLSSEISSSKDILADAAKYEAKIEELRKQQIQTILDSAQRVEKVCLQIKAWFEGNGPALQAAADYHIALLKTYSVDIPESGSAAFKLRFKIVLPDAGQIRGKQTPVQAEIFLVERATNIVVNKQSGRDATLAKDMGLTNQVPDEEIALGITFERLLLSNDKKLTLPESIFPSIRFDQEKFRLAMQRLGLPKIFQISKVDLPKIDPSLKSFVLSFAVQAPELELPGLLEAKDVLTTVSLTIESGKVTIEGLRAKIAELIDGVQKNFEAKVNSLISDLNKRGDILYVHPLEPVGQWSAGKVGYHSGVSLLRLGNLQFNREKTKWAALFYITNRADNWHFDFQTVGEPAAMVSEIRTVLAQEVTTQFRSVVKEEQFAKTADALGTFVTVKGLRWAPDNSILLEGTAAVTGLPTFAELPNLALPEFSFTLSRNGELKFRMEGFMTILKQNATALAKSLFNRLNSKLKKELVENLKGAHFSLFGLTGSISKVEAREVDVLIDVRVTVSPGKEFTVANLVLLDAQLSGGHLQAPRFDFRKAKVTPSIEAFLTEGLGIYQSIFKFSQLALTPDGVNFQLYLSIPTFGGDIPVGDVRLHASETKISVSKDAVMKALNERVRQYLRDKNIGIPDIGVARNVRLGDDTQFIGNPPKIWVEGEVPILEALDLVIPFKCRVYPDIAIDVDKKKAQDQAIKILKNSLGAIFPDSGLQKFDVQLKPLALLIDAKLSPWVFTADVRGIEISQSGIKLPRELSFQVPGFIPVPAAFAVVNPGVVVPLRKEGEIGVVGDITIASPGIDKVIKFRSRLATKITDVGKFKMEGTLVLVDALPLVQVDGQADFSKGKLSLNARTTGILDKIIQMRDKLSFDAEAKRYEQQGSLGVLGIRLAETQILIQIAGLNSKFSAATEVSLPIVRAMVEVDASLNFREIGAKAGFDVGLGGFTLAGAHMAADLRKVDLRFDVLLFKVTILAPSITTITPDRVLSAILNLLDFDITSFFESLIKRNITISFFDKSGKPIEGSVGQGDPPPPGGNDAPDNMADQQPPQTADNGDTAPKQESPAANTPENKIAQKTGQPPVPSVTSPPKGGYDLDVRTYVTGDVAFKFVKEGNVWFERYLWNKYTWDSSFAVSSVVKEHLTSSGTMLLTGLWMDTDECKVQSTYRNGQRLSWVLYYVTFTKDNQVFVCGGYPEGKVEKVSIPLDELGIKPEKDRHWWNLFTGGKKEYRFTKGEIDIIREFAKSQILNKPARFVARVDLKGTEVGQYKIEPQVVYKFQEPFWRTESLTLQFREGNAYAIPADSKEIYSVAQKKDKQSESFLTVLADANASGSAVSLVAASKGEFLFGRQPTSTRPGNTVWPLRSDGTILPPIRQIDGGRYHANSFYPEWPEHPFYSALRQELLSGKWSEFKIDSSSPDNLMAFVSTGALPTAKDAALPNQWEFKIIQWSQGSPKILGPFQSQLITAQYKKWIEQRTLRIIAFKDLDSSEARLWLLNQFIAEASRWPKTWNANPFLLLDVLNP